MKSVISTHQFVVLIAVPVGIVGIASAAFLHVELREQNRLLQQEVAGLNQSIDLLETNLDHAHEEIASLTDKNSGLSNNLQAEQSKNSVFESQIQQISGTVGTLTKLSQTDKELLQKYSKVYFLSENYVPSKLALIDTRYLLHTDKPEQFHGDVLPFLEEMIAEAAASGIDLKVVSAYRSFYDQISVKTGYKLLYGSGANQFSADQGYSEHQLGTAVDLTTSKLGDLSLQFEQQTAYKWLGDNAYRFGFILSYPRNNSYYQFEPWHWRFIGKALAARLHAENKRFYDLAQRDIDTYLISIFDR